MNEDDKKRRSKFMSYVLRHGAEQEKIAQDKEGWVGVDDLLLLLDKRGRTTTYPELIDIVETNDKQRFKFSDDMTKIRASQGHSTDVELNLKPVEPPVHLFHGTASRNVNSIRQAGLLKRGRQHVHLSADTITAKTVGAHHGKPVVYRVFAREMSGDGHKFFLSDNGVWLTDRVPPEYLKLVEDL